MLLSQGEEGERIRAKDQGERERGVEGGRKRERGRRSEEEREWRVGEPEPDYL